MKRIAARFFGGLSQGETAKSPRIGDRTGARAARRAMGTLLLGVAASGMVATSVLAQTVTIWRNSKPPASKTFVCGSAITVESPARDGRSMRATFFNTDNTRVEVYAKNSQEIKSAFAILECACFDPTRGSYRPSFDLVASWMSGKPSAYFVSGICP